MKVIILVVFAFILFCPTTWGLTVDEKIVDHHERIMKAISVEGGSNLSDEIDRIVVIRSENPNGSCGGLNYHRILYAFKRPLRGLQVSQLRPSGDIKGPHEGTDLSFETRVTRPAMQFHTYRSTPSSSQLETLAKRFEIAVDELRPYGDRLVEVDIDYDWRHISNPRCSVRPLWGSFVHFFIPIPRLFSESTDARLEKKLKLFGVTSFRSGPLLAKEVRP